MTLLEFLLRLASPTPGCTCETCEAIRAAYPKLARAQSKREGLKA